MTIFDTVILVIIILFLVRGVWVGFVRQLASIAALVLGFMIAGRYYQDLTPLTAAFISSPQIRFLVTYALLFLAVFCAVIVVGFVARKVVTLSLLDWFDRFLGGIFGLGKAVVVLSVLFMVASGFVAASNPMLGKSFFVPYLLKSSYFFRSFINDQDLQGRLQPREPAISLPVLSVPAGKSPRAGATKIAN